MECQGKRSEKPMGEYATRNKDGKEIKIGTCENMYYLRYSDRDKVSALPGNIDPMDESIISEIRWRLPFPDEDHIQPGDDYDPFRGVMLYRYEPGHTDDPGTLQLDTKYGMMLNVPCYHGEKLPENTGDIKPFWNGKGPAYALKFLKFIDGEPWGVYSCIECRKEWRAPLKELIPFIGGCDRALCIRLIEWYVPELNTLYRNRE
jgi:hypothetical protein